MTRIAFQLALIFLPLLLFAIYRIATRHRREPGEPWPVVILVSCGLALSVIFYLIIIFNDDHGDRTCSTPPRYENGELIPPQTIPCETQRIDGRKLDIDPGDIAPDDR